MKKTLPALFFICIASVCIADYWQQGVEYKIEVTVNDSTNTFKGTLELTYTNESPDTLSILYFRASANSLRSGSPLHRRDAVRGSSRYDDANPDEYGYCDIQSMKDLSGGNLNFKMDYSIIRAELQNPIIPGGTRKIQIEFTTRLPSARLGYRLARVRGQYKAAGWFPQICPYDRVYGWVNNQYLGWGENYADIADYDVTITIPSDFIVAATGVLQNRDEVLPDSLREMLDRKNFVRGGQPPDLQFLKGGTKSWRFQAENVPDFVFVADRKFCLDRAKWDGIVTYAFIRWEHADDWHDAAQIGMDGIRFFSDNFGRYAYPQMSITDSWSGMEYPMLVMCSGRSPDYYLLFWHEIAHNYFMGAVASNQTDRAFLDEGFTTFLEIAAMERFLGREDNLRRRTTWYDRHFTPFDEDRVYRGFRPYIDPALRGYTLPMPMNADKAPEWWIYRASSYYKPVCMLFALEYMLGGEMLFRCIREYYLRWKFRHPYETDMFDSFEQTSGSELTWFFEQWVYTDKKLDYALSAPELTGVEDGGNAFHYKIKVRRVGEMVTPLVVTVELKNGSVKKFWIPLNDAPPPPGEHITLPVWDQLRDPHSEFAAEIVIPAKIKSLDIDPDNLLADVNPLNNRWPLPKIRFDWLTSENYPPVDAYQIRHRPSIGYNAVDGAEFGWRVKGSFLEYKNQVDLSLRLGALNLPPDWSAAYRTPVSALNPNAFFSASAFDINGYSGGGLSVDYQEKPYYRGAPRAGVKVSLEHRRHYSDHYPLFPQAWSRGEDNSVFIRYWRDIFPDARMEIGLRTALFSGNFDYSLLEWNLRQKVRLSGKSSLTLRLGTGYLDGDNAPAQRLFYLSGWNPETGRSYEFMGVRGMIPPGWQEHSFTQTRPGILGCSNFFAGGDSYAAVNAELTLPPCVSRSFWLPVFGRIRPALQPLLFAGAAADPGGIFPGRETVWEAGPGFVLTGVPGGEFRLMFPLWLDPAPADEDEFDFRWVVSFIPDFEF